MGQGSCLDHDDNVVNNGGISTLVSSWMQGAQVHQSTLNQSGCFQTTDCFKALFKSF